MRGIAQPIDSGQVIADAVTPGALSQPRAPRPPNVAWRPDDLSWPCDVATPDDSDISDISDIPPDPDDPNGPRFVDELDIWDAELDVLLGRNQFSRVDTLEWELWDGHDQDQAERELLRRTAPPWVLLPPGGDLA